MEYVDTKKGTNLLMFRPIRDFVRICLFFGLVLALPPGPAAAAEGVQDLLGLSVDAAEGYARTVPSKHLPQALDVAVEGALRQGDPELHEVHEVHRSGQLRTARQLESRMAISLSWTRQNRTRSTSPRAVQ